MSDQPNETDQPFDLLSQEGRVARTARMLNERQKLRPNQRKDICERFKRFIEEHGYTQNAVAREIGISSTTISEVVRQRYSGKTADTHLVKVHNWMELAARRENIVHARTFVETTVAREILQVAGIVAETCKMGVVFGPAQLGKTFTLKAIERDQRFGDPVLIRVDESLLRPFALCRAVASKFELSTSGTFDTVFRRVVTRLQGTKRMLMFDEIERVHYQTLEMIRDLHDQTGCPVLLCGKPAIYAKLGLREVGDFSEVTDQLAARIVVRRNLTERAQGDNPQPLFSLDDIRKLIKHSDLKLQVSKDAEKWLRGRASILGAGGLGKALVSLYLAYKLAFVKGDDVITVDHLEDVDDLSMGHEDAERIAEVVAESSGMKRVV
jgi:DNA transposition AAA+ family ATPase